jgi:nitroreductase
MTVEPELPELYDALLTTRAMRRFTDEPVPAEVVEAVLRAAVQAPSGGNIQPYQFVVVTDPDKRARLAQLYLRAWERYEPAVAKVTPPPRSEEAAASHRRNLAASDHLARNLGRVPVLVLVVVPRISMAVEDGEGVMDVGPVHASVYPAVQNLVLAARAFGLGTVLTTVYRIYEDEVRAVCAIPDRYEVAALLPLGHPTGRWGIAPRRPAASITSWDTFGAGRATRTGSEPDR